MKCKQMVMSDSTAFLVSECLDLLERRSNELDDVTMVFGVEYDNGYEPIFMVMANRVEIQGHLAS